MSVPFWYTPKPVLSADKKFQPITQTLLDYWFKADYMLWLQTYTRDCQRGQIRYSRTMCEFYEKEYLRDVWKEIRVRDIEEMKAYICSMDEGEI